jgi:copper chaperone NosL
MNKLWRRIISIALALVAAVLLALSLKLPLWQMKMEAPQYKDEEALNVVVFPGALRGDIREITVLNQYIGVHIPEQLPQLEWLPQALLAAGALGLLASVLPMAARKWSLVVAPTALALALMFAAIQAQKQMHDIGHNRDRKTKLARVKDFTPPLFGKVKIFQFEMESTFGTGAYLIGAAIFLQFTGAWINRRCTNQGCTECGPKLRRSNPRHREVLA